MTSSATAPSLTARHSWAKLFVLSTAMLYLELTLVRWINAYVQNFGFFTNFIVLASFLGMGVGCLLAARPTNLVKGFPIALLALVVVVAQFRFNLAVADRGALFWGDFGADGARGGQTALPPMYLVPLIFTLTTLPTLFLAQSMGRLFGELPPLRAYAANVAGSLLGIVGFSLGSMLALGPDVWFTVCALLVLPSLYERRAMFVLQLAALACVSWTVHSMNRDDVWSPYYRQRIDLSAKGEYLLSGNGTIGIALTLFREEKSFYTIPYGGYEGMSPRIYERVLVIGAGGGNEVSVALKKGANEVDAVDINPFVFEAGRALHPDHPYQSTRVHMTVDDGRNFLRRSDARWDLIVYGLPDSTGLVSSYANMRVESYLFTVEAFRSARAHLAPDGVFAVYNFYRDEWLITKIAAMLGEAFGSAPLVLPLTDDEGRMLPHAPAVLMAGPGVQKLIHRPIAARVADEPLVNATDDWPFLYLKRPGIPAVYWKALGAALVVVLAILGIAYASLARASGETRRRIEWPFFFMGAAFMLLEARSIVTFGLLFGATWVTSSLVMAGILSMVLLALFVEGRFRAPSSALYAALFGSLALVWAIPPEALAIGNATLRYGLAVVAGFSPVLFANLIFARTFARSTETPTSLASNVLGALLGGMAEYLSLAIGQRHLLVVAAILYALAFVPRWRERPFAVPP